MKRKNAAAFVLSLSFLLVLGNYESYGQNWSSVSIASLPDSSFASVEIDEDGSKVRHFPYRDARGTVDISQVIYCLGTFSSETWIDPGQREAAGKVLEEHYHRFKLNLIKEEIKERVNINTATLKELVRLPNIGPVTAVEIYVLRETEGHFQNIEEIKKVEGIGPAIFAGIRHYIRVR